MGYELGIVIAFGLGLILLYIAGYFVIIPIKIIWKLMLNSLIGGILLVAINYLGKFFSIHLALNIISAIITGFLGVPGVVLLFIFEKIA